jgi:nucleoid DNA-binding protein
MKTMPIINRDAFIRRLAKRAGFTISDTSDFVNAVIDEFQEAVIRGETLKITGLGKLSTTQIEEHDGYDAVNNKRIKVPSSIRVNFRLAESIRTAHKNLVIIEDDEI